MIRIFRCNSESVVNIDIQLRKGEGQERGTVAEPKLDIDCHIADFTSSTSVVRSVDTHCTIDSYSCTPAERNASWSLL